MNINGTYKISIEMTARKQVQGLVGTTKRLLGHVGAEMPEPPDMEDHIKAVIDNFKANQEVFDSFEMTITDQSITVRTNEGEMTYDIKGKMEKDANHVVLRLESKEMGAVTWDATVFEKYFLFDSIDDMSEYAFERK